MKKLLTGLVLCLALVFGGVFAACASTENQAAKDVSVMIEQIGAISEISLDSRGEIEAARSAYDALSEEDKAEVPNYADLQAAEAELVTLGEIDALTLTITSAAAMKSGETYTPALSGYEYNDVQTTVAWSVADVGTTGASIENGVVTADGIGSFSLVATVSYAGHNITNQAAITVAVNGLAVTGTVELPEGNLGLVSQMSLRSEAGAIGQLAVTDGAIGFTIAVPTGAANLIFSAPGFEDVTLELDDVTADTEVETPVAFTAAEYAFEQGGTANRQAWYKDDDGSLVVESSRNDDISVVTLKDIESNTFVLSMKISGITDGGQNITNPAVDFDVGVNIWNGTHTVAYEVRENGNVARYSDAFDWNGEGWYNNVNKLIPGIVNTGLQLGANTDGAFTAEITLTAAYQNGIVYLWVNNTFYGVTALPEGFLSADDAPVQFGFFTRSGCGATFSEISFKTDAAAFEEQIADLVTVQGKIVVPEGNENLLAEGTVEADLFTAEIAADGTYSVIVPRDTQSLTVMLPAFAEKEVTLSNMTGGTVATQEDITFTNTDYSFKYTADIPWTKGENGAWTVPPAANVDQVYSAYFADPFASNGNLMASTYYLEATISNFQEVASKGLIYGFRVSNDLHLLITFDVKKYDELQIILLNNTNWAHDQMFGAENTENIRAQFTSALDISKEGNGSVKLAMVRDGTMLYLWVNDSFVGSMDASSSDRWGLTDEADIFGLSMRQLTYVTYSGISFSTDESFVQSKLGSIQEITISGQVVAPEEWGGQNLFSSGTGTVTAGAVSAQSAAIESSGNFSITLTTDLANPTPLVVSVPGFSKAVEYNFDQYIGTGPHAIGQIEFTSADYAFDYDSGSAWSYDGSNLKVTDATNDNSYGATFTGLTASNYVLKATISNFDSDSSTNLIYGFQVSNNLYVLIQFNNKVEANFTIKLHAHSPWLNQDILTSGVDDETKNAWKEAAYAPANGKDGSVTLKVVRQGVTLYLWINEMFVGSVDTSTLNNANLNLGTAAESFGLGIRANSYQTFSDISFSIDMGVVQAAIDSISSGETETPGQGTEEEA